MGKKYTEEQVAFVYENRMLYLSDLTARFNERFQCDKDKNCINGLRRRHGWLTGRAGQFHAGYKPWNAGMKGKGLYKNNSSSCFKKGHKPLNWKPVGSERIDVDGYVWIKTAEPRTWRMKHVLVWEAKHGRIMPGYIVRFKDNNPLNCDIDNLEMVSRRVHFRLNKSGYTMLPPELKPAAKAIAEVEVKIFELNSQGAVGTRHAGQPI